MTKFGLEIVSGQIIGDIYVTGQLFHEGRPQGPRFNGDNDAAVREQAIAYNARLKTTLGSVEYTRLYPHGMELRIWD